MQPLPDLPSLRAKPAGESPSSRLDRLLAGFEAHEADEARSVNEYRALLASVNDPATRAIIGLIVADEERHRALLASMIRTLRSGIAWQRVDGGLEGPADPEPVREALLARTAELIAVEQQGLRECRSLAASSGRFYDGLFEVLLDAIARDSAKHIALLEHLERHLRRLAVR